MSTRNELRPDLLNLLLLELGGSKYFRFRKIDLVSELSNARMHIASLQMARMWLTMKVITGCTVLFGSKIINYSQEEAINWQFIVKIS